MTWLATLQLDYTREESRSVAHYRHNGPLRILQSLYPEGDAICHNVAVHPPGATSPHPQVLVVRVLAPLVEPAFELLKALRACWRRERWQLAAVPPRV